MNKTIVAMLMLVMGLTTTSSFAQNHSKKHKEKNCCTMADCCVMKDGKMMMMKDGKMTPMDKDMTMKNGAKCTTNGECIMKDGKKMMMKDGQCMDMEGKMGECKMGSNANCCAQKQEGKSDMTATYTCPMHPEVVSDKEGKCPKCGMDLIKKK